MDVVTIRVTPTNPVTIPVTVMSGIAAGDYEVLTRKPSINSVVLLGNKTSTQLGLAGESEAVALRRWVAYLSQLVGRIPLYNSAGQFIDKWAAVVGIDDGEGVYNLKVDDADIIDTPVIPAILQEPV